MAKFTGTHTEFRRYIGPRLRNVVQQITRKHRDTIGSCEHCGTTSELESAHVRGRDRNQIIDMVLAPYTTDGFVEVELDVFEKVFKSEHDPLEKSILILCRGCHREYDSPKLEVARPDCTRVKYPTSVPRENNDILPISLEPSDLSEFKRLLLARRKAEIQIYYENGSKETRDWDASRFKASSNVLGNLRSRPEFRSGCWQSNKIVKVHVRVCQIA